MYHVTDCGYTVYSFLHGHGCVYFIFFKEKLGTFILYKHIMQLVKHDTKCNMLSVFLVWLSRSRSPQRCNWKSMSGDWQLNEREKQRQVEERRVIYVGRIEEGTSKAELRRRFEMFGPIVDISVHFREHGYIFEYRA
jgi:hypothetical protein